MKSRLLIILGMIIALSIFLIFVIPELWFDYFSYPQINPDIVCKMNGREWD